MTAMLKAGVPLGKIDRFRELLKENGFALTSATNLKHLVPFILNEEITQIKQEIDSKPVLIAFDGTTHVCEAIVVVLHYVTNDWVIQQKVCRLMLLAKCLTGEEVARQIIIVLSTELGILSLLVIAAIHDQASVNSVALRTVSIVYTHARPCWGAHEDTCAG